MKFKLFAIGVALAMLTVSCFDDNYDLSDIDTTSKVLVKDLVIPVKLGDVMLSDIIDPDPDSDSKIQQVEVDGKKVYAVVQSGTFDSDDIKIDRVEADSPYIPGSSDDLTKLIPSVGTSHRAPASQFAVAYEFDNIESDYEINCEVSNGIEALVSAEVKPIQFVASLTIEGAENVIKSISFEDLVMEMPAGLNGDVSVGNYDSETGVWEVGDYIVEGNSISVSISTSVLNFAANSPTDGLVTNGVLEFASAFRIRKGSLYIEPTIENGLPKELPDNLVIKGSYKVARVGDKPDYEKDIVATAISGKISYTLDGMNISDVDLSDVPDFLAQDVDLYLMNPRVYLNVNNPLYNIADNALGFNAGLTLVANRKDGSKVTAETTDILKVSKDEMFNFVLASEPKDITWAPEGYTNPALTPITLSNFNNILAPATPGAEGGLPASISVTIDNPEIPATDVENFELKDIPGVHGRYEFLSATQPDV